MNEIESSRARPAFKHALFLLVITCLVYSATLAFPFIGFDDKPFIVQNPSAHQWSSAFSSFLPNFIPDPAQKKSLKIANFYRPEIGIWQVLNYKVFGLNAAGWRASALALYCLGIWLFWRVAYKLTQDDFVALAGSLLFALHPLHVEGIAWLSGSCVELQLCVFFFGGFLAYLRWRETTSFKWLILCGSFILFALFSKETGAALPLLIGIHALLFRRDTTHSSDGSKGTLRWVLLGITVAAPVVLYAVLRSLAIHSVGIAQARHSWSEVFRSIPLFFVVYLQHALWPAHLANWYNIQVIPAINFTQFYLPLAVCLAYAGLAVWALIRKPLAGFFLVWWIVPLIPAFIGMINFIDTEYMHDRFTFEALAGLCVLAAMALRRLPTTSHSLFGFSAPSAAALALLTAIAGSLSALQVYTWRNDFAMAAHAIEVSPTAIRPRILLGAALQDRKDREGALALYRDTLKLDPNRWETLFAYGTALANAGDRVDGVRVLNHGLEIAPSKTAFYLILSDILADAGRFDDAYKLLDTGMSKAEQPDLLRSKYVQLQAQQRRTSVSKLQ